MKYAAFGTLFKRGDGGGPEVFATVGQVRNIQGPGISLETIDVTAHDSPNNFREFVASLKDGGEVTLEILFDPDDTTHTNLRLDQLNRVRRNFQIIWPDAGPATWAFAGFVTNYAPGAPHDDALTLSVSIKVTSAPTVS